jgi:hypothetical protein
MVDEQELTLASTVQNVTTTALPAPATSMVPICYEFLQGLLAHLFSVAAIPTINVAQPIPRRAVAQAPEP